MTVTSFKKRVRKIFHQNNCTSLCLVDNLGGQSLCLISDERMTLGFAHFVNIVIKPDLLYLFRDLSTFFQKLHVT